ncbi:MAG: hypothetical protein R3B48_08755 [Kofleriaceae bacterium]
MARPPRAGSIGPSGGAKARAYDYAADSNRLLATSAPGDPPGTRSHTYAYDAHGNMTAMPHLAALAWDHAERLQRADRGGGGQVWFVYDAAGERVRKVYEHGAYAEEQLYVGGRELFRKRGRTSGEVVFERATLPIEDDGRRLALVETETLDTSENARGALYNNTIGGVKQLATGIAEGDPESIGAGLFVAALAKAGGGANPKAPLSLPALAMVELPGFGRIPIVVVRTVPVTIPASEAAALANAGTMLMTGGDGSGGGSGKGSGSGKPAPRKSKPKAAPPKDLLATKIGGIKPTAAPTWRSASAGCSTSSRRASRGKNPWTLWTRGTPGTSEVGSRTSTSSRPCSRTSSTPSSRMADASSST